MSCGIRFIAGTNRVAHSERDSAKSRGGQARLINFSLRSNTVEFPFKTVCRSVIDFCNPAPDCEAAWIGQTNFEWAVEAILEMAPVKAVVVPAATI